MSRLPNIWLATAVAAVLALAGLGALELHLRVGAAIARVAEFERLRGEIERLNEVLVSSATLYAATEDPAWRDRYDAHVDPMDAAVAAALTLADSDAARAALEDVAAANGALILMETQAIAYVAEGQPGAAMALLASDGYRDRLDAYRAGIGRAMTAAATRVSGDTLFERRAMLALAAALLALGVGAAQAWRRARRRSVAEERALAALREQGDVLRALLADAPVAIALFDDARACVAASREFTELFGVTAGADPSEPAARAGRDALLDLEPGRPRADWIDAADGPARWVWRETRDWRDASGAVIGRIAAAADFTDLQQLQSAYREAHAQADEMGAVLEEARQEVYIFEADSLRFARVNRGARENLGYSAEEMARMTPLDLKPDMTAAQFAAIIAPLLDGTSDIVRIETEHRRKDGSRYPCEIALSLRGAAAARRFVAIVDDITERRAREAERARVTERLRLNEIALRGALAEADTASRLKSEFLARITHEIRTPLNGILGGLALIRATDDAAVRAQWLDIIEASAQALHQVIDDVLDIAQIEAGAELLEIESFDPLALVERAADAQRGRAETKGVALRVEAADKLPYAWRGDPKHMARVVRCLLDNAVKFTDSGAITVRIAGDATQLRLEVADTGPGVAETEHAAIFERFRQADGSATRKHGGVGLGLSIAREFTRLMQGRIGVRSTLGEGATFWLEFDALAPDPAATDIRAREIRAAE